MEDYGKKRQEQYDRYIQLSRDAYMCFSEGKFAKAIELYNASVSVAQTRRHCEDWGNVIVH